jgi:hypothetical protein
LRFFGECTLRADAVAKAELRSGGMPNIGVQLVAYVDFQADLQRRDSALGYNLSYG